MKDLCIICGERIFIDAHPLILNDRRKGVLGNWPLVKCNHCGVIFMTPMPTDDQLATYYAAYSQNDKVDLTRGVGAQYPKLRKLFHWFSGDVDPRDFIKVPKNTRVLDYGCGHANYLCDFHDRGVSISGAEITGHLVNTCRSNNLDVRKVDDFSHIPFGDSEFDIVYLMQVFEHLRDPHRFMKELFRILKNEGILYLAVPNADSIWRKVFARNWVSGWFAPFHLFHYNRDVLKKLAGQHGFDVVDSWSSTPVMWFILNLKATIYPTENILDERKNWLDSRPIRYLMMLVLRIIELPFNQRDCLVLKLKKRG